VSIFFKRSTETAESLLALRTGLRRSHRAVSADTALKASPVWAALRLRADLISTSPVDVYRDVGGRAFRVPTPPVLVYPGGKRVHITEWLYSSQVDLDRFGNTFGHITQIDGAGRPARIDLWSAEGVTVRTSGSEIVAFRYGNKDYDPAEVWHEKQYTVAGVPVGLSPLAYGALTISTHLSAQEFAADWFSGGAVPAAHLKNTAKKLEDTDARKVKDRFKSSVGNGDVFVTGNDWSYEMLGAKASEAAFLESIDHSAVDIARFLSVPADMIDVPVEGGSSVTYANITQRNLQLLIVNLGPAITRREVALSSLVAAPRFVKLNTDAVVLRMDAKSRAELNAVLLASKQRTPSEVREKDDLPPFTPEQIAEIQALTKAAPPAVTTTEQT
jgi:HK97 family phage portal protein